MTALKTITQPADDSTAGTADDSTMNTADDSTVDYSIMDDNSTEDSMANTADDNMARLQSSS